jgi:hypothetical protein
MTPPPIVVHVVSTLITHSGAARAEKVISVVSIDSRPAPIHPPVSGVVAIHKHIALPILISTAIIEQPIAGVVSIAEYVSLPAQFASTAAALRRCRCCCDAEYQNAKCDS